MTKALIKFILVVYAFVNVANKEKIQDISPSYEALQKRFIKLLNFDKDFTDTVYLIF